MGLDVRSGAVFDAPLADPQAGRCQLFAGHEGEHAIVYMGGSGKALVLWRRSTWRTVSVDTGMPHQMAWAPGFPRVFQLGE
jgi:hypothetical protein